MPANFPGSNNISDILAHRAATEAVLGLILQGEKPTAQNVKAWLNTAIEPNVPTRETIGRATYFAERMIGGPFRPDGSAG